ncbi:hypothetical protein BTO06_14050 [Tenacibaculum sp. SZ-18]|uniref:hypothetical protein n=1 Tax=Tenacibaculum sp. SZ-18 TaxID=754423 RepID=UPI000C2D3017|nr:hypothetical protein [Tenacibaculum sp. SZ-18]AUC16215.1 hypothetical protein BTO06_14050 [Tenacibaculum sp. SZ-18]
MILKVFNLRLLAIIGMVVLASCSDGEGIDTTETDLTTDDVEAVVLADDITADIDNILEDDDNDFNLLGKGVDQSKSSVSDCVVRTVEENPNENTVTITLDFGEGCVGKRGREFAGKIIIVYEKTDSGYSKSVTFEELSIDGNQLEGSKSIVKVKENGNGNKEATHTVDLSLTLSSGETVVLEGTRIREKIEGDNTFLRGDDVYSISGSWKFVNKYGIEFTGTITENLRREYACKYIVSGVTEISKNGEVYTLDFGDGSCNNKATLTNANGESMEISLRNK